MQTHSCGFCEEKVFPANAPKTLSDELSTFFSLLCIFNTKRRFSDVGKRVKFFRLLYGVKDEVLSITLSTPNDYFYHMCVYNFICK